MYNFDKIINRYQTGSYKYDRIKSLYPNATKDSIILTLADMDFETAPEIKEKLHELVDKGVFGYMTLFYAPYQEAIINWFARNYNLTINEDEIIYSNGTLEGLKTIINLFSSFDDYITVSTPVYGNFFSTIKETNRKICDVSLINNNGTYYFDFDKLRETLSLKDHSIYILCSPQNPTGRVWSKQELAKLINICQETNTILVSDEVHMDIRRKNVIHYPILSVTEDKTNIVMLTSIGKTFNMSGIQASNMIIKDKKIIKIIRDNYDRDISTFGEVSVIASYNYGDNWKNSLNEYLDDNIEVAINYIEENMKYCEVVKPDATYFLWLNFKNTGLTPKQIHEAIYEKANVFLEDGEVFDEKNSAYFQRMVVAVPRKTLLMALRRINEAFKEFGVKNEKI